MTKTKKLFLLAATFLFLNVCFLRIDALNNNTQAAFDCYDLCSDEVDPDACFADCEANSTYTDPSIEITPNVDNYTNLPGYKTDCSDYPGTHAETGLCLCDAGYVRQADQSCAAPGTADVTGSTCGDNAYKGRDGSCNCNEGFVKRRDGACYPVNADIATNDSGNDGSCDASESCWFINCCSSKTTVDSTIANAVAETKNAIKLKDGTVAPMGTIVNSDGSGTSPTGQTYPTGSFQPPSNGGSNDNYSPFVLGSNYGSGGVNAPKCGANFEDIGGVCFPTTTGLSNAPIYVILSNIFSWLMGLFTTFAVLAFVIAGVQYLLASGDESMAKSAKTNAVYAIIGIIVGLSGFIIIKAIAAALSGQSILF